MIQKCKICGCQFAVVWHEATDRCSACEKEHYKKLKAAAKQMVAFEAGDRMQEKIEWDKLV